MYFFYGSLDPELPLGEHKALLFLFGATALLDVENSGKLFPSPSGGGVLNKNFFFKKRKS